ncbi:MAG TPA: phosphohydrolase, partial [Planctomycetaceae bacterium]|nr:phosphohydrolase [Planctomycetaceae bacterium]
FLDDALRLRRWDDEAKIPNLRTPPLDHYAAILRGIT